MKTKLFIPKRIKIGFQERQDTFTGKLAYVIYFDEKNVLRKQKSWDSWRDDKIEPIEYDNSPQSGFILNKGIQRYSDWGSSRAVVRVYDSRDFEFEISIDNLLGILMHSDVSKRDIVEECVFAWSGTDLILLPCNSVEYQESVEYTNKQDMKVSTKELVPGCQYHKKKSDEILTYLGKFDWWDFKSTDTQKYGANKIHFNKGKKHIFWDGSSFKPTTPSILSSVVSEDIVDNYAFLVDDFFETINSQPIKTIKIIPYTKSVDDNRTWRDYPQLGIMVDNEMRTINTGNTYRDNTFDQIKLTQYTKRITFPASIEVEEIRYPRHGYNPNYYDTQKDITNELRPQLCNLAEIKGYDFVNLLPSQYLEIMTELGYGEFKFVLQNDKELEVKSFYWY